jgi:glucokinase
MMPMTLNHNATPGTPSDVARSKGELYLGLDIGGTKTAVMLADQALRPLSRITRATDKSHPDQLVAAILLAVDEALFLAGTQPEAISAAGVAVPGLVFPELGMAALAVNLNLENFPLGPVLSAELGVPCYLENDVRMAALGAYRYTSQSEQIRHLAYLSIGTGIAAGLILDGRLYRGAHGMAGEIGHIVVEPDGYLCGCGLHGCLEAMAAGPAVARMARELMGSRSGPADLDAEAVYLAAEKGEAPALEVVRRVSAYHAQAIHFLAMTYDVDEIILGGGLTKAGPAFLDPILTSLQAVREKSQLAHMMIDTRKISLLPADYNAGTWGAVSLAQQKTSLTRD